MYIGWWIIIGFAALLVLIVAVLILIGRAPALQALWTSIWDSEIGRNVILVIVLILVLEGVKAYTTGSAERKASEWLTSYNGVTTTDVVGRIEASVPGILSQTDRQTTTPSPSPTATVPPSLSPSPSLPTESASLAATGNPAADSQRAGAVATPTPLPTPTETEEKRIKVQLRTIRDRIKHHGDVMAYFYVNYFISIVMVMTAGVIVALTLFFIAQQGWTNTKSYVRSIFLVTSAYAAFYGLFPPVFQQQQNIVDNKDLFLKYKALESEVESYSVTLVTNKNEPKNAREFITYVDSEMSRLGNIALGFDITKVSYEKAIDLGEKRASPETTPTPKPSPTPRK